MKKSFFYLTMLTVMLFLSVTTKAQQARQTDASPKPPEMKAKIIGIDKEAVQPVVSPTAPESSVPSTAGIKSSEVNMKINKGNEQRQAKTSEVNAQPASVTPPRTDNLVVPNRKEPTPAKIKD